MLPRIATAAGLLAFAAALFMLTAHAKNTADAGMALMKTVDGGHAAFGMAALDAGHDAGYGVR